MGKVCPLCKQDVIPADAKVYKGQAYHSACFDQLKQSARKKNDQQARVFAGDPDELELITYVCQLFSLSDITPMISKQIENMRKQYNYTFKGIFLALRYFYELGRGGDSVEPDNQPSVGIVPYIYAEAADFWEATDAANQANAKQSVSNRTVVVRVRPRQSPPFFNYDIADL